MEWKHLRTESIIIDERRWPLVISRFVGPPSDKSIELYLSRATMALQAGHRYGLVMEGDRLRDIGAAHREKFSDWIAEMRPRIAELCVGQSYVLTNVLQRMVLRSVFMVSPLPVEYVVVPDREKAVAWTTARLEAAGHSVPEAPADWGT